MGARRDSDSIYELEPVVVSAGRTPRLIVVLVHGTGARKAGWTESGSKMCTRIRSSPDSDIYRFLWTGENSHQARLEAGDRLADQLQQLFAQPAHAASELLLIAHSHGGNVALYSLRPPGLQSRLSSLVCLATPFLTTEPTTLSEMVAIGCIFGAIPLLLFGLPYAISFASFAMRQWIWTAVVVAVAIPLLLLLRGALRGAGLRFYLWRFVSTLFDDTDPRSDKDRLTPPMVDTRKFVVFKVAADEAAGLLKASQFASWITLQFGSLTQRLIVFFAGLIIAALITRNMFYKIDTPVSWDYPFASFLWYAAMIGIVGAVILTVVLFALVGLLIFGSAPFGYDAAAYAVRLQTIPEDTPMGTSIVVQVNLDGFRHSSIYDSDDVIERVATIVAQGPGSILTVASGSPAPAALVQ